MDKEHKQGSAAGAVQQAEQPKEQQKEPVQDAVQPAQPQAAPHTAAQQAQSQMQKKKNMHRRTLIYTLIVFLYAILVKLIFFMRIEGRENIPKDRNCILLGNHQTLLDPVSLALCVPDREIHFMGKKELFEGKVSGWVFRQVHGFPVDRGNIDMAAIRTALGVLKDGDTLGIFPEGTRSKDGYMLPLLGGASMLALRSGCEVIPVYIDGRYKPFRRMTVRVGKPLVMEDLRAQRINKGTCDALTLRMEEAFAQLSGGKSRRPA